MILPDLRCLLTWSSALQSNAKAEVSAIELRLRLARNELMEGREDDCMPLHAAKSQACINPHSGCPGGDAWPSVGETFGPWARNQEQLRLEDLGCRRRALMHSPMFRSVHCNGCRRVGTSANDICIKCRRLLTFLVSCSNHTSSRSYNG